MGVEFVSIHNTSGEKYVVFVWSNHQVRMDSWYQTSYILNGCFIITVANDAIVPVLMNQFWLKN